MNLFGKGQYFDKLEDKVRRRLVRSPKVYAMITGLAAILSWVAIWAIVSHIVGIDSISGREPLLKVILLGLVSICTLLITGAFINLFGDSEMIEKTLKEVEKEKALVLKEESEIQVILRELKSVHEEIKNINEKLDRAEHPQ